MICNNCKKELKDDAKFCPYCGKAVTKNPEKETTRNNNIGYQYTDADPEKSAAKKSHPVLKMFGIVCATLCVIFVVLFGLSAVDYGVQEYESAKLSDINVIAAQRAVTAADEYLNGETRFATEAVRELENAINLMEPAETDEAKEITNNVKNSIKIILNEIQNEQWANGGSRGDGDMSKVKENRDLIVQYAGLE